MRIERTSSSSREQSLNVGLVSESSGSVRCHAGRTVATAVVLGPSVPKFSRHEDHRAMTVEVTYSTSLGGGSGAGDSAIGAGNELKRAERECARFIKSGILGAVDVTRSPRTLLVVKVTIDFDDGNALCTGFNACVMALLNAGVRMNYVPIAIGVACVEVDRELATTVFVPPSSSSSSSDTMESTQSGNVKVICVDPVKDEEDSALSKFYFVLRIPPSPHDIGADATGAQSGLDSTKSAAAVVHSRCKGTFSNENLEEATNLASTEATRMLAFIQNSVEF